MATKRRNTRSWIVYLSTYPPRECGIATFSRDLTRAFDEMYVPREESKVIALNANGVIGYNYSKRVLFGIDQYKKGDYKLAAEKMNKEKHVKLINIQHEFGILGHDGEWAMNVMEFLKVIQKPVVITFHTVLPHPNPQLREGVVSQSAFAQKIIVMTKLSKEILVRDYGVKENKIAIIPHGIHPVPYTNGVESKTTLRLSGRTVLSTFGLLSRGKGIEYSIEALPAVVKKYPNVLYLVIGATHPEVLKREGESYRNMLVEKVRELGLEKNVVFYNKYLELKELLQFLDATDIYLAMPLDPNQAVSGTLTYALGTGRPVISTDFAQAKEDVTEDVGIRVPFRDVPATTSALLRLLDDSELRATMARNAYFRTRRMEWRNVVIAYMKEYLSIVPELGRQEKNLPKIKLRHVIKMTDHFGMFQFANLTTPDPGSGYTLDDNARALIAMVMHYKAYRGAIALRLARTYLSFLEHTALPKKGFQNYVNHDKTFHHDRNTREDLSDANARAFYALALVASTHELPADLRHKAEKLFREKIDLDKKITSARSSAFYVKAFSLWLSIEKDEKIETILKGYCDYLVKLYEANSIQNWQWFEDTMTYSNALLPEALLVGYRHFDNPRYLTVAKSTLDFLISYSFQEDICVPIGQQGWFKKGGKKHSYDQQPEEVSQLVQTLKCMYTLTKDEMYRRYMYLAFNWFLGNNLLGQVVYDQSSGGCFDGMGESEINLNQGAESTVMYLMARLEL